MLLAFKLIEINGLSSASSVTFSGHHKLTKNKIHKKTNSPQKFFDQKVKSNAFSRLIVCLLFYSYKICTELRVTRQNDY